MKENTTVTRKPRRKQPKLQIINYPEEDPLVERLVYEHYLEIYHHLLEHIETK